jgi:hypothetical protein
MKKSIGILSLALVTALSTAQTKQERKAEGFTKISASSAIECIVTIGDKEGVVFEASEEALSKLKAEVRGGKLSLYVEGDLNNSSKMTAYVTAKKIEGLTATGAANVELKNALTCDEIEIEASGAGKVALEVTAKEVEAEASGAGVIKISGSSKTLKAKASGAGILKAGDLKSESVDIVCSGAGNAKVNASQNLNANASGAGSITYLGEPKNKTAKASSAGSIHKG